MPIFRNSRYITSSIIIDPDERSGSYLGTRRVYTREDFTNGATIVWEESFRPDLIANELYGSSHLWWIISEVNNKKFISDYQVGETIFIPHPDEVKLLT
jgi:hypothetical protein